MVKIGHASQSEHGTANGTKGDQNGREVFTRNYYVYEGGWKYVLRPTVDIAEKMAVACEKGCANNKIGYSQDTRNSLHNEARKVGYDLSRVSVPCNCDCSSFMVVCAIAAGVKSLEYTGNAPTTATMKDAFSRTGKFQVLTEKKYLESDTYLKRGDVLLSPGHHTVMVLSNGSKAGIAAGTKSISEIAKEVRQGKWGQGEERKRLLEQAGYPYAAVQAEINRSLGVQKKLVISDNGIEFIKQFESLRCKAYKDITGTWTIGWGTTSGVYEGMTITPEQANDMFRKDLVKFNNAVNALCLTLTQNQHDSLVSFAYNCGIGNLKKLVANRDYGDIADAMLLYNKAKVDGVLQVVKGLVRRREAERKLFLS